MAVTRPALSRNTDVGISCMPHCRYSASFRSIRRSAFPDSFDGKGDHVTPFSSSFFSAAFTDSLSGLSLSMKTSLAPSSSAIRCIRDALSSCPSQSGHQLAKNTIHTGTPLYASVRETAFPFASSRSEAGGRSPYARFCGRKSSGCASVPLSEDTDETDWAAL